MKRQCEIRLFLNDTQSVVIGTAEVELADEWDSLWRDYRFNKATLSRLNINIKKGDVIWEK